MWYMYDGATAHFSRAVRVVLNNTYRERLTGTGGHIAWPPHLPDKNLLDIFLLGRLDPLRTRLLLKAIKLWMPVRLYAITPASFEWMRRSMMRRIEACIESNGRHSEHLL
jgi:hypothetical protein